jgi:hypothetical protein
MKKILILVEGPTEERFIKDILSPIFSDKGYLLVATIVNTKMVKSTGTYYKGGWVSYEKAKRDLLNLLKDSNAIAVTTMFDYYGLPRDFPIWTSTGDCYEKVRLAEESFGSDINSDRFIPYLQLHEFEALLFSSPENIADALDRRKIGELENIRSSFNSPEEINHGPQTHPSKRLVTMFENYNKPIFGSLIAQRSGLSLLRESCPHFDSWLTRLEAL